MENTFENTSLAANDVFYFSFISLAGDAAPQALINIETDLSLKFILDTPLDALMAVEVSSKVSVFERMRG